MFKVVVRSLVVLVALVFVAAVFGAYADEVGGRFGENNVAKVESAGTFHASLHQLPVAELSSYSAFGEDHESWRITGIRDGHWLRLTLCKGWEGSGGQFIPPSPSSPPPQPGIPGTVATPEPGTLVLLAAGLFIASRRVLKA